MEALFFVVFFLGFYFIPWIVASGRSHPNTVAIFVLNLLGGWTAIGWIAALVWSFTSPAKPAVAVHVPAPAASEPQDPVALRIGQLERLSKLKAEGALSDEEYEQEKRRLLS